MSQEYTGYDELRCSVMEKIMGNGDVVMTTSLMTTVAVWRSGDSVLDHVQNEGKNYNGRSTLVAHFGPRRRPTTFVHGRPTMVGFFDPGHQPCEF